jgi:DNA-binding NarL/FixJ family response regulator
LNKPSVLLADDHPGVTEVVAHRLRPAFEVVGIVHDGQALLDSATKLNPDLIITDIFMPILNGIEAVKRFRGSGCKSKVIFLTICADSDFVKTCFSVGAIGYVVKSRIATDLMPGVKAALSGKIFVSQGVSDQEGA